MPGVIIPRKTVHELHRLLEDGGFEVIGAVGDAEALVAAIERRALAAAVLTASTPANAAQAATRRARRSPSEKADRSPPVMAYPSGLAETKKPCPSGSHPLRRRSPEWCV